MTARPDEAPLPAATRARFALLLATVLSGAAALNAYLIDVLLRAFPAFPVLGQYRCYAGLDANVRAGRPGYGLAFYDCLQSTKAAEGAAEAALVVLVAVVAAVIYRAYPWLITRAVAARPLADLADVASTGVLATVDEELSAAGRPVTTLVAMDRPGTSARAFGCYPRYQVLLDFGLLTTAVRNPGRLRAVLAHEMAHIGNADIDITYLTTAAWWAFLVVEVPLSVAATVRAPGLLLPQSWRFALILALIWVARSAVLRTREYYADAGADRHPRAGGALRQTLADLAGQRRRGVAARLLGLAANHPAATDRLAVLADQGPLWRAWAADALVAGALIGIAYNPVDQVLTDLRVTGNYSWHIVLLGVLVGLPLAGAVAAPLWREVYHRACLGLPPRPAWRAGVCLATGIIVGQLVAPPLISVSGLTSILRSRPLPGLALIGALYVVCWLLAEWVTLCAAVWLATARSPRAAYRAGLAMSVLVAGVWMSYWFGGQTLLLETSSPWRILELMGTTIPLVNYLVISLMLAVIYPAIAWRPGRSRISGPVSSRPVPSVPVPVALLLAAILVVAAGLVPLAFGGYIRTAFAAAIRQHGGLVVDLAILRIFALSGAVAAVAFGALRGGRGGPTRCAVAAAGLAALVAAPFTVWLTDFHIFDAQTGHWWNGITYLPEHPVNDTRTLLGYWFTVLAASAMAAALAGAVLRAALRVAANGRRAALATGPAPAEGELLARGAGWRFGRRTAGLLPGLLVASLVAFFAVQNLLGLTPQATPASPALTFGYTPAQVIGAQRGYRPGTLSRPVACALLMSAQTSFVSGSFLSPDQGYFMEASSAAYAYGSNDFLLASLGLAVARAMEANDAAQAGDISVAAYSYCSLVTAAARASSP